MEKGDTLLRAALREALERRGWTLQDREGSEEAQRMGFRFWASKDGKPGVWCSAPTELELLGMVDGWEQERQ
jgi:8-oxo-dGTP pyrophosphatase MutT (NUDIX family)